MAKARPKYVANRTFMVGRFKFERGDPVTGGRPLELGLRHGFVDSTAKSAQADPVPETLPESPADLQENPT